MHSFSSILADKKKLSASFALWEHQARVEALERIAAQLKLDSQKILTANNRDQEECQALGQETDRLTLNPQRLEGIISGLAKLCALADPLGEQSSWLHPKGMKISKHNVPLGLILIIYEARPNVTIDSVGLCLLTGNIPLLRGSQSCKHTNLALAQSIEAALTPINAQDLVHIYHDLSREGTAELLRSPELDLIIPRGGEELKKLVKAQAVAPVLGAGGGVCHLYVSDQADLNKASGIALNAKTQRPSTCNALETLLLHQNHLNPETINQLLNPLLEAGVELRVSAELMAFNPAFKAAQESDWGQEFLSLTLAVKLVSSLEEAIAHINLHGTGHSDAIVTEDQLEAKRFTGLVDSAVVYHNASTRFTDGEEFGFGAEIGISTQKLHARGPLGANQLTTYKYIVEGHGQTR